MPEKFLSEEDLDLRNLSWEELNLWWDHWLAQAQSTNDLDEHLYSHGVFRVEPGWVITKIGVERDPRGPSTGGGARRDN